MVRHKPIKCQIPWEYSHTVSVISCTSVINHFTHNHTRGWEDWCALCEYVSKQMTQANHNASFSLTVMMSEWKERASTMWEKWKRVWQTDCVEDHHAQSILKRHSIIPTSNSIHALYVANSLKSSILNLYDWWSHKHRKRIYTFIWDPFWQLGHNLY